MERSKQYLWCAALLVFLVSSTSFFWGDFRQFTVFEGALLFLAMPTMGLLPFYGFLNKKEIGVGLIWAKPEESLKQIFVLSFAAFLLFFPIYYMVMV